MAATVIVTHGNLGSELLGAAQTIVGRPLPFEIVTLDWDDTIEEAGAKARPLLERLAAAGEVLILTDIFGGTPYNVVAGYRQPGRVEVVTGVNLPMVVRLGCPGAGDMAVGELAAWIQEKARAAICRAAEPEAANGDGAGREEE